MIKVKDIQLETIFLGNDCSNILLAFDLTFLIPRRLKLKIDEILAICWGKE